MFKILGILEKINEQRGVKDPPAHFYKYPETNQIDRIDANPLLPPLDPTPNRPLVSTDTPPSLCFRRNLNSRLFKPSMWFVPQFRLEAAFRKELEKYDVAVELNHELVSFEQTSTKVVAQVKIRSDEGKVYEEIEASYLIGADGAKGVSEIVHPVIRSIHNVLQGSLGNFSNSIFWGRLLTPTVCLLRTWLWMA